MIRSITIKSYARVGWSRFRCTNGIWKREVVFSHGAEECVGSITVFQELWIMWYSLDQRYWGDEHERVITDVREATKHRIPVCCEPFG